MSDSVSDVIFNISDVSGDSASSDSAETSSGGSLGDSSRDSSASYYDSASSNSSLSSQICGGAGGSESSDSSSGFDCCPNGVLEDAFRALVADSNSSTDWSSVYLSVYRRSFIVVANAYSEETEVECTLSPAQLKNNITKKIFGSRASCDFRVQFQGLQVNLNHFLMRFWIFSFKVLKSRFQTKGFQISIFVNIEPTMSKSYQNHPISS